MSFIYKYHNTGAVSAFVLQQQYQPMYVQILQIICPIKNISPKVSKMSNTLSIPQLLTNIDLNVIGMANI